MYVRRGDKVAFRSSDVDIFDTRSVFWFWQQQPKSSCGRRIPASLALCVSCTRNPSAICVLINCHGQTSLLFSGGLFPKGKLLQRETSSSSPSHGGRTQAEQLLYPVLRPLTLTVPGAFKENPGIMHKICVLVR